MQATLRSEEWLRIKHFLTSGKTGARIEFGKKRLLRDRSNIIVEEIQTANSSTNQEQEFPADLFGFQFRGGIVKDQPLLDKDPFHEYIDADKVERKTLSLRCWKPGDRFIPLGMNNYKKVSDYLIDEKVDLFSKERQIVLTADNEIVWLCGRRLSDTVKITPETKRVMELSMVRK